MGMIRGKESFSSNYSLSFSNGQCGRYSVHPVPVDMRLIGSPMPVMKREIAAM